jgi:hypothetical protein
MRKIIVLAVAIAAASSCGPPELGAPLSISAFKNITVSATGGCGPGSTTLTANTYDQASGSSFLVAANIINGLGSNASETDGRLSTFDVTLEEVRVTVENAAGAQLVGERVIANSIPVTAGGAADAVLILWEPATGATLAPGLVRARVHLRGRTADGTPVRTNTGVFTVNVCSGCVTPPCASPATCLSAPGGTLGQGDGYLCP